MMENDEQLEKADLDQRQKIHERNLRNYQRHKEQILTAAKKWRDEHVDRCKEINRAWRERNRKKILDYAMKAREKNPDYARQYWQEHKDAINARRREKTAMRTGERKKPGRKPKVLPDAESNETK